VKLSVTVQASRAAIIKNKAMAELREIQAAIAELSSDDREALLAWLLDDDRKAWDEQISCDFSEGGAGMKTTGGYRRANQPRQFSAIRVDTIRSYALPSFWDCYRQLPEQIRTLADKQFHLVSRKSISSLRGFRWQGRSVDCRGGPKLSCNGTPAGR
jgi:hypothetical protein